MQMSDKEFKEAYKTYISISKETIKNRRPDAKTFNKAFLSVYEPVMLEMGV